MIYLDNHTASRPFSETLDLQAFFAKEYWGNTQSPHSIGQMPISLLNRSMISLYQDIGANKEDDCLIASSGKDIIEQLLFAAYLDLAKATGKNHYICPHSLDKNQNFAALGLIAKKVPYNAQGQIERQALWEAISPRTGFVSIPWANGLTGVIQPIFDLAEVCKEKGVILHVDASYVIGKLYFRLSDLDIPLVSFDGRALHAPSGSAALFMKPGHALSRLKSNGLQGLETSLMTLSDSVKRSLSFFEHISTEIARLRDKLEKGIQENYPESIVLFSDADRLPNCTAIAFPGIASESLQYLLNRKGLCAASGFFEHLIACGLDEKIAHSALSFSLSHDTTEEMIDRAIEIIATCTKQLRPLSKELL